MALNGDGPEWRCEPHLGPLRTETPVIFIISSSPPPIPEVQVPYTFIVLVPPIFHQLEPCRGSFLYTRTTAKKKPWKTDIQGHLFSQVVIIIDIICIPRRNSGASSPWLTYRQLSILHGAVSTTDYYRPDDLVSILG